MKVALTGANGLVGSEVAKLLMADGHQVQIVLREKADVTLLASSLSSLKVQHTDILDMSGLCRAFEGADAVVHCAAKVSFNARDEVEMFHANVHGTANVVNSCLTVGIPRLVHLSSVAALGRSANDTRIDETAQWKPGPLNTEYAQSKYLAELEVRRGEAEGLSTVLLCPSVILGAGRLDSGSTRIFEYVLKGRKFYPDGDINHVDLRDVAKAVSITLERPELTGRFIVNGGTVSYKQLFETIAMEFGVKPPSIRVPNALLSAFWPLETVRSGITGKDPIITRQTAMLSKMRFSYDSSLAREKMGIDFVGLSETVSHVAAVLRERGIR